MSVDDSAASDQQKLTEGADSDPTNKQLPDDNGKSSAAQSSTGQHPEAGLSRNVHAGVTDADWHAPSAMPAMKSQDELMNHLSEALEEMASDFGDAGEAPPKHPAPPQHPGPSQQIRSSLPPGSLPGKAQPKPESPQHFFVLEGMAPPATPSAQQPADGLEVRRIIATQQKTPNSEAAAESEKVAEPPTNLPKTVGAAAGTNQVALPPMFGSRQKEHVRDQNLPSNVDQQKAHTGLQAVSKTQKQSQEDISTATDLEVIPHTKLTSDAPEGKIDTKIPVDKQPTRAHSVLTGHNFAPRQADPRSTMSAMQALSPPVPAAPVPGPVSQLGAALASSLPSNPPTGHYVVPAALRDMPDDANPLGPANSRPIPKLDQTGAAQMPSGVLPAAAAQAPPQVSANPFGAPPSPFPQLAQPPGAAPNTTPPDNYTEQLYGKAAPTKELSAPDVNSEDAPDATTLAQELSFSMDDALAPKSPPAFGVKPSNIDPLQAFPQHTSSVAPQSSSAPPKVNLPPVKPLQPIHGAPNPGMPSGGPTGPVGRPTVQPATAYPGTPPVNPIASHPGVPLTNPVTSHPGVPLANPITSNPNVPPANSSPSHPGVPPANPTTSHPGFPPANPTTSHPGFPPANPTTSHPGFPPGNPSASNFGMPSLPNPITPGAIAPSNANTPVPRQSFQPNTSSGVGSQNQSAPNLPPFIQHPKRTYNDLREETGMVLPHSAPEPDPNQILGSEFGKSVPGVTPVSKPFETNAGRERREAKEREIEAMSKIQLPATTQSQPEKESDPPPLQSPPQSTSKSSRAAKEAAEAPTQRESQKSRRQSDSGKSARFANLAHDNASSRSLRASQSSGGGAGIANFARNNWRVGVLASLAVLSVISVSTMVAMNSKSLFRPPLSPSQKAGEEAYAEGNFDRAVNYFNEAIKADQKRADLYHDRARAYLRLQQYPEAVADYSAALRLDPNFTSARLDRAAAYYFLGNYTKAIADYDELIKQDQRNVDAYFGRGLSHSKLHSYDAALADLNKVVELKPMHPGAFEDIANAYLAQGKLSEAIDAYSHSIKNNQRDANAYYMRGNAYRRLNRINEALNDYSTAIDVAPGRYEFYNDRGYAHFESGRLKDALADYATALTLNPNYEVAKKNRQIASDKLIASLGTAKTAEQLGDLAFAYFTTEKYSEALSAANRALLLNSQYRPALNIRAAVELKQRRFDYALTDAENILKIKEDDKDALLTRARANLNLGRYEKAIKDYDTCVAENDNTSLFALRERALAHLLANEGAMAATDVQQFMDLNGWNNSLSGPTALLGWLSKRQLQDSDGANAMLSEAETHLKSSQWPYPILKFLKREISLSQLSATARSEREKTDVRTWSGFDHLLGGMREEAHHDFDWVKRSGYKDNDDRVLAVEQIRSENEAR